MGAEITTPSGFNALSPQQQEAHRAKIGVRSRAILRSFWFDDETSDAEQALELESWVDVLENCSHSEIRNAWAIYIKTGPRTKAKKLCKPDAGALYHIILKSRPKPVIAATRPETREEREARQAKRANGPVVNAERAAQADAIMKQVTLRGTVK